MLRFSQSRRGLGGGRLEGDHLQIGKLPGVLRVFWRPAGYSYAAAALGRLPSERCDLLVIDIRRRLMSLRHHSQFVYLAGPSIYRFILSPTDGLQPSIGDIPANLEIAGRVNPEAVKIATALCPENQAAGYGRVAGWKNDFDPNVSILKNVRLIQYTLGRVLGWFKRELTVLDTQTFTGNAPARVQFSEFVLVENLPCNCP